MLLFLASLAYFMFIFLVFFFFKQKTAYEVRISDWSSDVCSSDLGVAGHRRGQPDPGRRQRDRRAGGGPGRKPLRQVDPDARLAHQGRPHEGGDPYKEDRKSVV